MAINNQQQVDPIIKKYFDLIKASNPDAFKGFYYGDPVRIPTSMMPALIGARRMTNVAPTTNAEDEHVMQLVFTVVTDIRKDISDETQLTPGWNTLYDLVEGRDPETLLLKPQSLMYILRHHISLDDAHQLWTDIRTPTKVDFGLVANKRMQGGWSIEAAVTTNANLVQYR